MTLSDIPHDHQCNLCGHDTVPAPIGGCSNHECNDFRNGVNMKEVLLVGGTGGLGSLLYKETIKWNADQSKELLIPIKISSRDMDLSSEQSIMDMIQARKPDIVVNLSALSLDSSIGKLDAVDTMRQLSVNCFGSAILLREFIKISRGRGYGRYIYTSSVLSERPVPGAGIYSATKAFNDNLIKTAALENGKHGITFNSIQLGYFGAGLCDKLPENIKLDVINRIPTKRWGKIEELANLVKYFIDTEYANGSVVKLTGGIDI